MFERAEDTIFKSVSGKDGGHYNSFYIKNGKGMEALRLFFPDGEANEFNLALFSTSGVHGTYTTIEEIEAGLKRYGDDADFPEGWPDDYHGKTLTVLIVQPRICTMRHGTAEVALADIAFLKKLRESSRKEFCKIGQSEQ